MASLACASASAAASGRTRISTPSTGRGASGTASSSCREMMTSMPSSARRSSGYRPRRHVAFVSADGAVDDVPSSSASEQQMAVSSTATRQSGASTSSVLNSLPAIPPSQLEEEYLMGSRLEREQWFPVAFASDLGEGTMIPFDLFNVPWVAFRDEKGQAGCVKDECAHRACPISLGKLVEGKVQCPYHGWEYTTGGECVKMPSIKKLLPDVFVDAAPVVERDGLLRVWAGKWSTDMDVQQAALQKLDSKALACPDRFTTMAEVTVELEMEAHEVMERLMDLAGRSTSTEKVDFTRIDAAIANDDVFSQNHRRSVAVAKNGFTEGNLVPPVTGFGITSRPGRRRRGLEHPPNARGVAVQAWEVQSAVPHEHGLRAFTASRAIYRGKGLERPRRDGAARAAGGCQGERRSAREQRSRDVPKVDEGSVY